MTPEERDRLRKKIFSGDKVDKEALEKLAKELRNEQRDKDFDKAIELWMAGWTSEPLHEGLEIMSWYWRRPPRPGRTRGRLFMITDQAYNHMKSENKSK